MIKPFPPEMGNHALMKRLGTNRLFQLAVNLKAYCGCCGDMPKNEHRKDFTKCGVFHDW